MVETILREIVRKPEDEKSRQTINNATRQSIENSETIGAETS